MQSYTNIQLGLISVTNIRCMHVFQFVVQTQTKQIKALFGVVVFGVVVFGGLCVFQ